jgi:hypothetical protein
MGQPFFVFAGTFLLDGRVLACFDPEWPVLNAAVAEFRELYNAFGVCGLFTAYATGVEFDEFRKIPAPCRCLPEFGPPAFQPRVEGEAN